MKIKINKAALGEVLFYVLFVVMMSLLYLVSESDGFRAVIYIIVMLYAASQFSRWLFEE